MRSVKRTGVVLAALLALSTGVQAQAADQNISLAIGPDLSSREHGGALELRFGHGRGVVAHQFGVAASYAPMGDLVCRIRPDGGCFDNERGLITVF